MDQLVHTSFLILYNVFQFLTLLEKFSFEYFFHAEIFYFSHSSSKWKLRVPQSFPISCNPKTVIYCIIALFALLKIKEPNLPSLSSEYLLYDINGTFLPNF
jgi:hypothetical protein